MSGHRKFQVLRDQLRGDPERRALIEKHRLSVADELNSMSPREFVEKQRKEADKIRERWAAEDADGETEQPES